MRPSRGESEDPAGSFEVSRASFFAPGCSAGGGKFGGPDQIRTDDLLNAIEALFQLSYEPISQTRGQENRSSAGERKRFFNAPD